VLLVFLLFPLRMRLALDRVERHPGLAAFVGIAAAIAVLPVAILLAISIVGIPLIVLEFAAVFVGIWLGTGAIALLVGRRLTEQMLPSTTPSPLYALQTAPHALSRVPLRAASRSLSH
jgi:membrane-bound ClpP family serine protease